MGLQSLAAARFYKAFKARQAGRASKLVFEGWPFSTMCRTYDLETMVTDSASSATAYLTGTKTRTGVLGLTGAVQFGECRAYREHEKTQSVLKAAAERGLATGIVTTARVTHASPAGAYGHAGSRDWESDADIWRDCRGRSCRCRDLASQLVLENPNINVILGGGQVNFYPNHTRLPCSPQKLGARQDGRRLAELWLRRQKARGRRAEYLGSPRDFPVDFSLDTDYLLGLAAASHLPFELDRKEGDPSLANLTRLAINVLKRSKKGFFLFVEAGRIDHAHHFGQAKKALEEVLGLEEAVKTALAMVDAEETLIIVTADHSHSFELVGEPSRFQNVLEIDEIFSQKTLDGKPMTAVGYMNGPGARTEEPRADLHEFSSAQLTDKEFRQQALVPLSDATHGGEDVGVYATGPFSHLFHRNIDNTYLAHVMKWSLCLSPYQREAHCSRANRWSSVSFLSLIFPLLTQIY
nr:unnamed protein product [Spirometra erinaceieuropaei]